MYLIFTAFYETMKTMKVNCLGAHFVECVSKLFAFVHQNYECICYVYFSSTKTDGVYESGRIFPHV